jgi:hypothetical protein
MENSDPGRPQFHTNVPIPNSDVDQQYLQFREFQRNQGSFPSQQPATKKARLSGAAVTSLVLGIVALSLSFVPIVNNVTAVGGVVGAAFGIVGLFGSRKVLSFVGLALAVGGIAATFAFMAAFSASLDKLGNDIKHGISKSENKNAYQADASVASDAYNTSSGHYAVSETSLVSAGFLYSVPSDVSSTARNAT